MKGRNHYLGLKWCMSQWISLVIFFSLPHSETACTVPNCNQLQCNGNTCDGCKDGYFLLSGSCKQCPDRCSTCTSDTQCTTCKDTHWNLLGGCASTCSTNCTNNVCDDTTGYCNQCKPGTYGPQCGQDCNLCKDGQCDLRKCTNGCNDGYYQHNRDYGFSDCFKCVYDNCITCSNGTYCTLCEQGYYRNYYRLDSDGRGRINCLQCYDSCLDCTYTEYCPKDCQQHCGEPVNPGTTKSTNKTTTIQSTVSKITSSKTEPPTRTQKTSEAIKSTEPTPHEDFKILVEELYKELNSCQQQIKTCSENEDQYQLTFGHGIATGIGIAIVLFGSGVGIVLYIRRLTKLHKHADGNSEGHHEYVNTNMTDIMTVISPDNNEVNNDIHTVSSNSTTGGVTNVDLNRDYVMLGDRPTHESDYTDLQTT